MEAGAPIREVRNAPLFNRADDKGRDIVIVDSEGVRHSLRIENSNAEAQRFKRRMNGNGMFSIAVIVARFDDPHQLILDKIREVIPSLREPEPKEGDAQ